MPEFIDQTGRSVIIQKNPQRIISLVPSQTELLFDLGLDTVVTGITKFCVHPEEWFHTKRSVGGTKQVRMDVIEQLQPDLIIANKEENVKEQVEELAKQYPVWVSDVNNLEDACKMIEQIGRITCKQAPADKMISLVRRNFVAPALPGGRLQTSNSKARTCYLIWRNPYMTVGGDTFIHAMLEAAGFDNLFRNRTRYPEVSISEIGTMNCELLLLSSEPYPFQQKHMDELQAQIPDTKIVLVDGEMFSWYGSHLLKAPSYFTNLQQQIK
ncbi:MAG: helical backbone metal receptor [Bacteroidota bacterium]|nr:helical backbone metal receptor [Bacteroidota bacterium]